MKTQNITIAILIICIIVLASLSIMIYYKGKNNSCSVCEIEFKQHKRAGMNIDDNFNFKIRAEDLYTNLSKGHCLVKWDNVQGHIRN